MASLLNTRVVALYGLRGRPKVTQVPMLADMIDEPQHDLVVDTLHALPRKEAEYYVLQENIVIQGASSESIFKTSLNSTASSVVNSSSMFTTSRDGSPRTCGPGP